MTNARDVMDVATDIACGVGNRYGGHVYTGTDRDTIELGIRRLTAAGYRLVGPGELGAIEMALDYAKRPLANDLEIGFRHGELSPKEKLERYAETCACIEHDLSAALRSLQGGGGDD